MAASLIAACSKDEATSSSPDAAVTAVVPGPDGYRRCDADKRFGNFSVQLVPVVGDVPAHTQIGGRVRNGIAGRELWDTLQQVGDCRVLVGPRLLCDPACIGGMSCERGNRCVTEPSSQDVGAVTVSGLAAAPVMLDASLGGYFASLPTSTPHPPVAPGTVLRLDAKGAAVPGFSLATKAIDPLAFDADLTLARGTPLAVTWTPPKTETGARISLVLDIAHHGGIAARIECHVGDTGSATVPSALVDALLDRGTAGFPMITLTRQTIEAAPVGAGCVEFAVTSAVERFVSVPGVVSCHEDEQCPTGKVCGNAKKCE